jgi:hypothetical protein
VPLGKISKSSRSMGPVLTASYSVEIRKLQMTVRGARSNLFSKTAGILGAKCTIHYYPLLSITIRILQEIASTMWMSTPFSTRFRNTARLWGAIHLLWIGDSSTRLYSALS